MNAWVEQIFQSQQAKRGGIVRRKIASVDRHASLAELKRAAKRHGFMILQNNDQYLLMGSKNFRVISAR